VTGYATLTDDIGYFKAFIVDKDLDREGDEYDVTEIAFNECNIPQISEDIKTGWFPYILCPEYDKFDLFSSYIDR
jgi:hypothetical protein